MRARSHRRLLGAIVALQIVTAFGVVGSAWAGPYLFTTIEMAKAATSQQECNGQIGRVLRAAEKEQRLSVDKNNAHLGFTPDSTVGVDCIFVGQNEQRRDQWIFYIAIASTNLQESQNLMKLLRQKFNAIVRID